LRKVPQALGVAAGAMIGSAWIVGAAPLFPRGGMLSRPMMLVLGVTLVLAVAGVMYALLAIRRRGWAYLYHGFAGAGTLVFLMLAFQVFILIADPSGARWYTGLTGLMVTLLAVVCFFSRASARPGPSPA